MSRSQRDAEMRVWTEEPPLAKRAEGLSCLPIHEPGQGLCLPQRQHYVLKHESKLRAWIGLAGASPRGRGPRNCLSAPLLSLASFSCTRRCLAFARWTRENLFALCFSMGESSGDCGRNCPLVLSDPIWPSVATLTGHLGTHWGELWSLILCWVTLTSGTYC